MCNYYSFLDHVSSRQEVEYNLALSHGTLAETAETSETIALAKAAALALSNKNAADVLHQSNTNLQVRWFPQNCNALLSI
jgi:hypothetical protein